MTVKTNITNTETIVKASWLPMMIIALAQYPDELQRQRLAGFNWGHR